MNSLLDEVIDKLLKLTKNEDHSDEISDIINEIFRHGNKFRGPLTYDRLIEIKSRLNLLEESSTS
jgi:hypothetical protein